MLAFLIVKGKAVGEGVSIVCIAVVLGTDRYLLWSIEVVVTPASSMILILEGIFFTLLFASSFYQRLEHFR